MVQVENEVGVIPESRDHSAIANTAFAASVFITRNIVFDSNEMTKTSFAGERKRENGSRPE
jgi:hypothetical protein